ncbi:hypothetical protein ASPVEDRAFT_47790 [Aspergillus versicolor CBS 583.65]|uniref:Uncharacterized protein n=1 Tax=Aspergillus versicolor CBS 583.65 TaxID=1036611 RepID=A0A1L9Q4H3_ASPVE|nr:uncharacterized protein ASPVEDRAFT_47790 [Aspergillus versicolor CBS 583.65]OJJ08646.1 hypothetical protein ASPVEDRAFT_47790 [Aspergillus versicolor CBS 583.65]
MVSLDELHEDILHQLAQICNKSDILSLRLTSRRLFTLFAPYLDQVLVSEICAGTHTHLHRAAAAPPPQSPAQDPYEHRILERLLKANAPAHQHDKNSETALHAASRSGNLAAVHALLDAGAEANALSYHGWTPLRLACRYGHADVARVLLDSGAGAHESGSFGWTAMQYVLWNGHEGCMEVLREYGVTSTDALTAVDRVKQQWGVYEFPN